MKTKVFNFVRGLSNGTPPRFQSYLKSLTLILTLLLSVNVWGATKSFTPANFNGQGSSSGGSISYTNSPITVSSSKGYGYSSGQTRIYSGGTLVVSCSSGYTITEVALSFTGTSYQGGLSTSYKGLSTTSWTSPTLTGTARISGITVTYTSAAPATLHTVRFYKTDGTYTDLTEASVGAGVTPPTMQAACGDWEFQGWSKTESDDAESTDELILETLSSGKYYPSSNVTLYPVYTMEETIESDVSDEITQSTTGLPTSGSSGYTAWNNKTVTSDAVYAGQSNKAVSYLQLRNQSPSGIISTSSGGILKKVTVAWASNNTSGRYVTIFGKKSAYTECANLYNNSAKGTSLGTIVYETSTELDNLNKNDEYTYVGVLASAAVYINKITVTWAVEEDVTYYFSYPSCGPSTYTLLFSGHKSGHFRAF